MKTIRDLIEAIRELTAAIRELRKAQASAQGGNGGVGGPGEE